MSGSSSLSRDADRPVEELHVPLLQARGELHPHRLHVPKFPLLKARQPVRDHLREHRDDLLRQVDAGCPAAGLGVERAARLGEVADVRDVDGQHPVPGLRVDRHRRRVIEVAGVHRVDGHDQLVGEVGAAGEVGLGERGRRLAGLVQRRGRELLGQAERLDDRDQVDARLGVRAEHLGDDALAAALRRREPEHLDDDLVLRPGPLRPRVADRDAVREHGAVHADQPLPVPLEVRADERAGGPPQDADDLAGRVFDPGRQPGDADEHLVAGRGVPRLVLADVDVRAGGAVDGVRPHVPVPGRGPAVRADDGAVRVGRADRLVLPDREPAGLDEVADGPAEVGVVGVAEVEPLEQLLRLERRVARPGHRVDDPGGEVGHGWGKSEIRSSKSETLANTS